MGKPLTVLSLGAGVQSTTMALMAAAGEIKPMPDCAIFADTQWEPVEVYKHLEWLEGQLPFPVHKVTAGDLRSDVLRGKNTSGGDFHSMPLYMETGPGRRQCTKEYKLYPIRKQAKIVLNYQSGKRVPKNAITMWIGISTDEAQRMKPSTVAYVNNVWPLIDIGMSRRDCVGWFEERWPGRALVKSACIGCPYHSDVAWREMKTNDSVSFRDAVEFDKALRPEKSSHKLQYLHQSLLPLDEVDFRTLEDMGQMNLFGNECEGLCGV